MNGLNAADGLELITYIKRRKTDDLLFQRWVAGYQNEMSFDDFKTRLTLQKTKSEDEILEEVYKAFEKVGK